MVGLSIEGRSGAGEGGLTAVLGREAGASRAGTRLAFVDNIRVLLTILVVAHHAGQPYGPTGGEWPIVNPEHTRALGPFFAVNAAFFMGFFFLISGYFLPGAYDRKGAAAFLKERFLRLGLPLALFGLVFFGPITYLEYRDSAEGGRSFWGYFFRVYLGEGRVEFAHLWFVAHLLFYAVCYAAWRRFAPHLRRVSGTDRQGMAAPGHRAILLFTVALALVTFVVRIEYPIDSWAQFLVIIPVEWAHAPQYLALFVVGIAAARRDWLRRLPAATGMAWLWIGGVAALARYGYALVGGRQLPALIAPGGLDWRSLVWSGWEAVICVGLCVGLLTLARERFNGGGWPARALSTNAYAVYVIHLWPVAGLQFALANVSLHPFAKFVLVTVAAVPLCFLIGRLLRSLPPVRRVL
ncbi:MAG: acyltransferase [Chloroflexota bacterium]|nr:acyltransferase [Chloroflexota bacterium]